MCNKRNKDIKKSKNNSFIFYTRPLFPPIYKRKNKYSILKIKTQKLIKIFKI